MLLSYWYLNEEARRLCCCGKHYKFSIKTLLNLMYVIGLRIWDTWRCIISSELIKIVLIFIGLSWTMYSWVCWGFLKDIRYTRPRVEQWICTSIIIYNYMYYSLLKTNQNTKRSTIFVNNKKSTCCSKKKKIIIN